MKKQIFLVLACLVGAVQVFASGCDTDYCNPCPTDCCLDFDSKITAGIGGGVRWDNLSWKTSASNFSSSSDEFRQKWSDIKLGVIEANFSILACEHYLLKGDFDYGWVYGKNHLSTNGFGDSSDFFDSSSSNFSSNSKKGNAYDLSAAIGYQFNFDCYQVSFAPLLGYSYNYLRLNRRGFDLYDGGLSSSSSSDSNSHTFRTSGPWLGFATYWNATCELSVYLDYAFHWANLRATVDEALFFQTYGPSSGVSKSLTSKNTYGNEVTLGGTYTLCDCWFAGLKFNYKNWCSSKKHHSHSPYSSSFSSSSEESSRFRHFDWNTYALTVDVGYTF